MTCVNCLLEAFLFSFSYFYLLPSLRQLCCWDMNSHHVFHSRVVFYGSKVHSSVLITGRRILNLDHKMYYYPRRLKALCNYEHLTSDLRAILNM